MPHSKNKQRGATLAGYALVLSAFTALSLGAIEGLNSASTSYLNNTSDDIAESRELALYDELEEIPAPTGDGTNTGENDDDSSQFDLVDGGQIVGTREGFCINLEVGGRLAMRDCDGSTTQEIEVYTNPESNESQLRIAGLCIGNQNNSNSNGDPYILEDCDDDDASQLFNRVGDEWQSVAFTSPQMCLDSGGAGEGQLLHQWQCGGNSNQQWSEPEPYVPPFPGAPTPSVTGEGAIVGDIPDGHDFSPNVAPYTDDNSLFVFSESVIELASPWTIDGNTLDAGTFVCSYIVWYSPVNNNEVAATIDFGAPVVGGSESTSELQSTSQFEAAGVDYQNYNRPWEGGDGFNVSGNTVGFTPYAVSNNADMVRVFTQCG